MRGETGDAIRSDPAIGGLVFSVAIPVQRYKQVLGAFMLSTGSSEIEEELRTVRLEHAAHLRGGAPRHRAADVVLSRRHDRLPSDTPTGRGGERARGRRTRSVHFTRRGDEIGDIRLIAGSTNAPNGPSGRRTSADVGVD